MTVKIEPKFTAGTLLEIKNLTVNFFMYEGTLNAVDRLSLEIGRNRSLGIIGESGCGKSITALSIMGLVPQPPGSIAGEILYHTEKDPPLALHAFPPYGQEYRDIRGKHIAMIFQEPMTCLNPVFTIGDQITEAIMLHQTVDKKNARTRAVEMLNQVHFPDPDNSLDVYPYQLSGGMRQRVMIAMALSCNPDLLIADEPTTALDVTIQIQILDLIKELQEKFHMSLLLITHDMGVVAYMTDEVIVMYLGQIVETGTVGELFKNPLHPYTVGLLKSLPRIGSSSKQPITPIRGTVSKPINLPRSCRFLGRCDKKMLKCREEPPLFTLGESRRARCWLHEGSGVL